MERNKTEDSNQLRPLYEAVPIGYPEPTSNLHNFKDNNSVNKHLVAEKFFGYTHKDICNIYSHQVSMWNLITGKVRLTLVCNHEGSHKGNPQGSGYVLIQVTVIKVSDGSTVREGQVYHTGKLNGDRKINLNNHELLNINYGFAVNVFAKIDCYGGVYKAHIWGGRSWISVVRMASLKIEGSRASKTIEQKNVQFELNSSNQFFSSEHFSSKSDVIEGVLGKKLLINLNTSFICSFYKKSAISKKIKETLFFGDLTNNFNKEFEVEKINFRERVESIGITKDTKFTEIFLDTTSLTNVNKIIFEKTILHKDKTLSFKLFSRISKQSNTDIEITIRIETINQKKGETITCVNEEVFFNVVGMYTFAEKLEE